MVFVFLKKHCSAKSDERILCSANCKRQKVLFTKLAENGVTYGEKICLFFGSLALPEQGQGVGCSLYSVGSLA